MQDHSSSSSSVPPTPPAADPYAPPTNLAAPPPNYGGHTAAPTQKTLGIATASLVLGIMSILLTGIFTAIPGIICGHMARSQIKREPGVYSNESMALIGLIMSYIILALTIIMIIVVLGVFSYAVNNNPNW